MLAGTRPWWGKICFVGSVRTQRRVRCRWHRSSQSAKPERQTHPRTDQEQSTPDHHKGAHINNTRGLLEHRARVISETAPQSTPTQPTNPGHLLHTTTTAREEDEALQPNTQKQIHRRSQDEKTKKRAPNQRPGEIPRTRTQRNGGKPLQRARQK